MAVKFVAIQTLLSFVSYTLAHQSSLEPNVVVLGQTGTGETGNVDPTCLVRNPPVVRRNDYTYFPGIGGYKLHSQAVPWNQARIACEEEGGHLAIINSLAERDAMLRMIRAKTPVPDHVNIGFHDYYQEGQFVTIHGQTLARAGFNEWASEEPNSEGGTENCGSLHQSGGLNDQRCHRPHSFICELPIY